MSRFIERPRYVCALGGAVGTLKVLPQVVPILHSATGCGGNVANALSNGAGYLGSGYCAGQALPSTNVTEKDIVFGGEDRLTEQIENTIKIVDGVLYFVATGCMVDMIGDDIRNVIRKFDNREVRVIGAETGGFHGNFFKGYEIVLSTLFREFVEKKSVKEPNTVNLWGVVPIQDVFWKGNLSALKGLLSKLGLRVNTFFGEGETLDNLRNSASAALNLVVSDTFGVEAAQVFEEAHDVPYITVPLPIGDHGTGKFLRTVGDALGIDKAFVEKVIKEEQASYYGYFERIADVYSDLDLQRYVVVVGDSNYTQALTRFLADDLGWLPELVVITDLLNDEQQELVRKNYNHYESGVQPEIIFDTDASNVGKYISQHWGQSHGQRYFEGFNPGFIIGSAIERDVAESFKVPQLTVTYPISNRVVLNRGYAGYAGALSLTEDILSTLVGSR
ncbi:MAG: nitrogenase component 1 [Syntrophomonadaceae bacterium]|nr:nitrogenase component 1 [Syntrophomonadaceae bacterium]